MIADRLEGDMNRPHGDATFLMNQGPMTRLLVAMTASLLLIAASGPLWAAAGPSIEVSRDEMDMGSVQCGDILKGSFTVRNAGDDVLTLKELRTSCGCTGVSAGAEELKPGEKTYVTVTYDSTGVAAGKKTQTVSIHSNDPRVPVAAVRIYTTVVQQVKIEPSSIVGKTGASEEPLSFKLRVSNSSERPVSLTLGSTRGALSDAHIEPSTVSVGPGKEEAFTLLGKVKGSADSKIKRGALVLKTDHPKEDSIVVNVFLKAQ